MEGATTCPGCGDPLNGRTCNECGYNPGEDETVRCVDCGDEVTEERAESVKISTDFAGRDRYDYFCPACDPDDFYAREVIGE